MIKPFDLIIIFLALGIIFYSAHTAHKGHDESSRVLIRAQDVVWKFPLKTTETIAVTGPLGDTIIRIHDERAWVEFSPCQNQTCVAQGSVRRAGQWAACLPNNVLLMIEGNKKGLNGDDIDAFVW